MQGINHNHKHIDEYNSKKDIHCYRIFYPSENKEYNKGNNKDVQNICKRDVKKAENCLYHQVFFYTLTNINKKNISG